MAKKILFFSGGSYISGLEVVTLHLMKGLLEKGYEVRCIFSGWNDGSFKKRLDEIGVPNYAIKIGWLYIRKPLWTLDTLLNYPRAYFACKKILKDFKPDICQFCSFSTSVLFYPLINTKAIYNLQESYLPNFKEKAIFRLLNRKISCFTAVSNHIVDVLQSLNIPNEKIKLIYNGITFPEISTDHESANGIGSIIKFSIIGQVVAWKGHNTIIEAAESLIKNRITNFKVIVYGNDTTQFSKEVKRYIHQKGIGKYFEWKGFINDQTEMYNNCDVVIVPSLSGEPCSLTIIESMARSKAVIVSDRGGNPELVEDQLNGMVFSATNSNQLSCCMEYLIKNEGKIVMFGKAARNTAERNYTYLKMTANYCDLYNSIS